MALLGHSFDYLTLKQLDCGTSLRRRFGFFLQLAPFDSNMQNLALAFAAIYTIK